jgi:hypothetical protein
LLFSSSALFVLFLERSAALLTLNELSLLPQTRRQDPLLLAGRRDRRDGRPVHRGRVRRQPRVQPGGPRGSAEAASAAHQVHARSVLHERRSRHRPTSGRAGLPDIQTNRERSRQPLQHGLGEAARVAPELPR